MINYDIENELKPVLSAGEKLIWAGRPRKGIVFRNSDAILIPFSLIWGSVVFGIFSSFTTFGLPFPFSLVQIPFVVVAIYITVGRFFVDAQKRASTTYGITQDRIIIKSGFFNKEIKSLNIKTLSDISLNQKADGSGTISLGPTDSRYSMMQGMEWPGVKQPPRLEFIEDVRNVYDKIMELQRH